MRFFELDVLRGVAVVAMVAFHALFDLNFFAGFSFVLSSGFFLVLARFSAACFVFLVGLCLTISYSRACRLGSGLFGKYLFRGLRIFSLGLLITLFTLFLFPEYVVWFGVLHLIGVSVVLAFPFVRRRFLALFLGVCFVAVGLWLSGFYFPFPWLLWLGLRPVGFQSLDFVPLLPWFGVVLVGVFFGNLLYPNGERGFGLGDFSGFAVVRFFSFLGRHSLLVYFLHQPLLVGLILLFS